MKVQYRTVENFRETQTKEFKNALHLVIGDSKIRITEKDGVLELMGDSSLMIKPTASNVIKVYQE